MYVAVADSLITSLWRCEMKKLTLAVCLLLSAAYPALPSALAGDRCMMLQKPATSGK